MRTLRIQYIQHVPFEGLGYIESWANERNHILTPIKVYENATFPDPDELDMLVIMGGPMSINDEEIFPWLKPEKKFVRSVIEAGKIVLGICLGSQLIANVLGARVYANKTKEIGWFPVSLTDTAKTEEIFQGFPESLTVMHWHGETFDLPENSLHIIRTDVCDNQAFLYNGRVLGLQFHMETTPESLAFLVDNCRDELVPDAFIQSEEKILSGVSHCKEINRLLAKLLDQLSETGI